MEVHFPERLPNINGTYIPNKKEIPLEIKHHRGFRYLVASISEEGEFYYKDDGKSSSTCEASEYIYKTIDPQNSKDYFHQLAELLELLNVTKDLHSFQSYQPMGWHDWNTGEYFKKTKRKILFGIILSKIDDYIERNKNFKKHYMNWFMK
jgi:hypothetical protein